MKIITLLCAAFLSVSVNAQKITADKVPAAVTNSFKAKFPKAEKVTWELEKKTSYEANFKLNNAEQSSTFDANGKWMETETEIKISELPQAIQQTMSKQFADYKIHEACKLEDVQHGHCYEVEIKKDKVKYDVLLNDKGEVLSKEADNGDKD